MRTLSNKVIMIFVVAISLFLSSLSFAATFARSMWVWESHTRAALHDIDEREKLLDFSVEKNIETLYLYADSYDGGGYDGNDVVDNPGLYQSFIADAHNRGLEVHALLGSRALETWEYFLPANHHKAETMITNVLDYNTISASTETFDGFNVDIEPYILSGWWANQPQYSIDYLDMLQKQKDLITDSGQDMLFGPVIPRWYEDQPSLVVEWPVDPDNENKNLLLHIIDLSDYITVMDYRNTLSIIIDNAEDELQYAEDTGKKVVVGIETAYDQEDSILSFYGYSEQQMEDILGPAEDAFEAYSSYDGIALHSYDSYYQMVNSSVAVPEPTTMLLFFVSNLFLVAANFFKK